MSDYGDAIDEARVAYAEAAPDFFPDVCTVSIPGSPAASRGQFTAGASIEIEGVPCRYEGLSAYERSAGGAVIGDATHVVELPVVWEGEHLAVPASATILVEGRGSAPARNFSVTGVLPTSSRMTQKVAATLGT